METEYIDDYKEFAIYQDMYNGYFFAKNDKGKIVSNEATINLVKSDIDILINSPKIKSR